MRTPTSSLVGLLAALPAAQAFGSLRGENHIPPSTVDTFRWKNPFIGDLASAPHGFKAVCEATKTFKARQHTLRDHMEPPPKGFGPWAEGMKPQFGGRPFPGHWDGLDEHGTLRKILIMEYSDVPVAVKDWVETEAGQGKGFFGVYDKPTEARKVVNETSGPRMTSDDRGENQVVIFAAGALYEILPLWVAEGSKCQEDFANLKKYVIEPDEDTVVAWPVSYSRPDTFRDKRDIEFTIRAQLLKKAPKKKSATSTASVEKPKESQESSEKDKETKAAEAETPTKEADTKTTTKDEL